MKDPGYASEGERSMIDIWLPKNKFFLKSRQGNYDNLFK